MKGNIKMAVTRKSKMPTDPLGRSIFVRERAIERMQNNITRILEEAGEKAKEVEKRIAEKKVLLDALKRGKLS